MKTALVWLFITNFMVLFLLLLPFTAIADRGLVRGSMPGELYVYGVGDKYPAWVGWLYRSIDSGQTVYLQNASAPVNGCGLGEGAVAGELYKTNFAELSYSDTYGVSFVHKDTIADLEAIASGFVSGEIYAYAYPSSKYSSDYGETFIDKGTCPGWVSCMSVGHSPGEVYCGCYYGEIYFSSNYGETYELIVDSMALGDFRCISLGSEVGEIYLLNNDMRLYYSPNGGDTLYEQYTFSSEHMAGMTGGFSPGEVFAVESEWYFMGGGDLYIHRSTDYGQTFTRYHVYSAQQDVILPEAITDLEATLMDNSVVLTWTAIDQDIWGYSEMIDYYVVYRDTVPDFEPTPEDSIGAPLEPMYIDSSAEGAAAHFYVVTAVDTSGNKSKISNRVGKMSRSLVSY
jgi:hypothetical protein